MNILQLEQERAKLKEKLTAQYSAQARLLFLCSFFDKVLSTENNNLIDAFLPEFISEYVFCLKNHSVLGLKPRLNESIIEQVEQIKNSGHTSGFEEFSVILTRLKNDLENLQKILNGEHIEAIEAKAYFPLLEEDAIKETGITNGILESVTVKINLTKNSDKFIIVPSEKEIEEKIIEQIKFSWMNAVNIAKKYIKRIHPYHEVIISFDKKAGFCKGNSLGTALTLSFIEEIFKTCNSSLSIKVGERIAFTGGMDEQGKITATSEGIIKQKTELIFFADISLFIVPKQEESAANEKLNELKEKFPQRDLKIIGIEDINDLLDRRTIVEIKKQPVIVRSGKFVKKNWVSAAVAIFLTMILSFVFVLDFNDNPAIIKYRNKTISILNKNSKILWNIKVNFTTQEADIIPDLLNSFALILDINSDGTNEVLITQLLNPNDDKTEEMGNIVCLDKDRNIKWEYTFKDTIYSNREELKPEYRVMFINTTTQVDKKILWCDANNLSSFSSAIFGLELRTGKRIENTLWCCGHTLGAKIVDLNNDGDKEFIGAGVDNGLKNLVVWGTKLDKLNGFRPTTDNYRIKNMDEAELLFYIRLPNTDLDKLNGARTIGLEDGSLQFNKENKYINFVTTCLIEPLNKKSLNSIYYYLSDNLIDFDIYLYDEFSKLRDSLVAVGKLKPPYTDTKEYKQILKNQILYYKNGEWITRKYLN